MTRKCVRCKAVVEIRMLRSSEAAAGKTFWCKTCQREYKERRRLDCNHPVPTQEFWGRFWEKVKKTADCWLWRGAKSGSGYGRVEWNTRMHAAHRLVYEHFVGRIPKGSIVCHTCDVPLCVNPKHLWAGTAKENMQDAIQKGRFRRGETHGMSKLKTHEVIAIRKAWNEGIFKQTELAQQYGVTKHTIHLIVHNRVWKWVA